MGFLLDMLLLATAWTHVLLAPYTKVEESFNLHAVHDVLMYGILPQSIKFYDHLKFPGVVPRTFVGSISLAWTSFPVLRLAGHLGFISSKMDIQIIVRMVLATLNVLGLCLLQRAVRHQFGRLTSILFVLLTCSQFHVPFWMGRTLPNMFAFLPVNISSYLWMSRQLHSKRSFAMGTYSSLCLLIFTCIVFRCEVLLLLAPVTVQALLLKHISLSGILISGCAAALFSIALTTFVDSYFWSQWPLWPELSSFIFNVYAGKSAEWGTSPFHAYLTSHLPKSLLGSLPLSIFGAIIDSRIRTDLIPSFAFIVLISFLGHKEWRFVVYTVPVFNVAAARGAAWIISRRNLSSLNRLLFLAVPAIISLNAFATFVFTSASIANYPGGHSLSRFNQIMGTKHQVHVHICNLAAQTGASLFMHAHSLPDLRPFTHSPSTTMGWVYNKTEALEWENLTSNVVITHLIAERPPSSDEWQVVEGISGFAGWQIDMRGIRSPWGIVNMKKEHKLWIMKRKRSGLGKSRETTSTLL